MSLRVHFEKPYKFNAIQYNFIFLHFINVIPLGMMSGFFSVVSLVCQTVVPHKNAYYTIFKVSLNFIVIFKARKKSKRQKPEYCRKAAVERESDCADYGSFSRSTPKSCVSQQQLFCFLPTS